MIKNIFFTLLLQVLAVSAWAQVELTVTGKVIGDLKGLDQVFFYNQMSKDTATIRDGVFQCKLKAQGAELRFFYLQYEAKGLGMFTPMPLLVDRTGKVNLTIDVRQIPITMTMGGEKVPVKVFQFQQHMQQVYVHTHKQLSGSFPKEAFREGHAAYEELKTKRAQIMEKSVDSLLKVYLNGTTPVAEAYILMSQANGLGLVRLEKAYAELSKVAKDTDFGKTVLAKISGLKQEAAGQAIPDFKLKDPKGTLFSLEQFRGKYVLVDFWASWCVPCRSSFPRIREVYAKLHGKPFEIINISIDQNQKAWLKAVDEDKNPWLQLYDDQKIGYRHFNVQALPTTFLLDPEGKIILKEIGFEAKGGGTIEKKLEEIFKTTF